MKRNETNALRCDDASTDLDNLGADSASHSERHSLRSDTQRLTGANSDQESRSSEDDTAPEREGEETTLTKSTTTPYLTVFAWWIPELVASLLSIASLACIVEVLRRFNGSPLIEVSLPKHLTLNGIIAALATVNRACLNTPVCSALLQQMWLYLASQTDSPEPPRSRLRDLELYTRASTGAWGCLIFLCKARVTR